MEVSDLPSTDTLRPDATLLQLASSAAIFGVRTVTAWAGAYLPGSPRLSIFCVCARVSSSSPPPLPLLGFVLYYLSDFSPSYWAPFMRVLPSDRTVSKNLPISRVSIIASWLSNPATPSLTILVNPQPYLLVYRYAVNLLGRLQDHRIRSLFW